MRLLNFLQYNNAVPLTIGIMFFGATGAFAATDPQAIYSTEQHVISIDNTYLASKDFSTWTPRVQITGITEDADNYYVAYAFSTIDLQDSVWQDAQKLVTLTVSKADLGPYRDLGIYVTEQLKQVIDREYGRLVETQDFERKNISQKTVATTYGGLIGKMLDDKTETLPGYTPVVTPPVGASEPSSGSAVAVNSGTSAEPTSVGGVLQILGNNPSYIPLRSTYADLGAIIVDPRYAQFGIHVFQNGTKVQNVAIDTSTTSETTIRYSVFTGTAYVGDMTRRVFVYDPANPPVFETQAINVSSPPPQVAPVTSPEPASTPSPQISTTDSSPPPTTAPLMASTTPDTNASSTTTSSTDTSSGTQNTATSSDTQTPPTAPESSDNATTTP